MRAAARLVVARDRGPVADEATRITVLRSQAPLVLRPTKLFGQHAMAPWQLPTPPRQVSLVAGAGGPVGGDQLSLDVEVGSGCALVVRSVAATVALPGPHDEPSRLDVTVRVGAGATLAWWPGPLIAAARCHHEVVTRVDLEAGARLLVREELVLGRHGEEPGSIDQRLRVCLEGRPLHDQRLRVGPGAPGWDGPAVTGGRRAIGTLVVVDGEPNLRVVDGDNGGAGARRSGRGEGCDTGVMTLPGGQGVLVSALAADSLTLRGNLDAVLRSLQRTCCR